MLSQRSLVKETISNVLGTISVLSIIFDRISINNIIFKSLTVNNWGVHISGTFTLHIIPSNFDKKTNIKHKTDHLFSSRCYNKHFVKYTITFLIQ